MSKDEEKNVPAMPGAPGYKPVGEVNELAVNAKTGVRVVSDDKAVWKEAGATKKGK